ncbi:hypothetical protein CBM2605_A140151 [Cupriavidus neocaledonicus]|uniref:Transposase n=1 Tax=Cupriavidus neocaledonicus TaxID=1040979 RepID=A0ABY1UWY0_9BURK|nr:hypothetical protein CBM2605_A140151 [Cupriavidus neocaledonicus]
MLRGVLSLARQNAAPVSGTLKTSNATLRESLDPGLKRTFRRYLHLFGYPCSRAGRTGWGA